MVTGGIDPALLPSNASDALNLLSQYDDTLHLRTPTRGAMLLTLAYDTGSLPTPSAAWCASTCAG